MASQRIASRAIPSLGRAGAFPRGFINARSCSLKNAILYRSLHNTSLMAQAAAGAQVASRPDDFEMHHRPIQNPRDATNFIDNVAVPSKADRWFPIHDPATNSIVSRAPQSTPEELRAAVESAQKAFPVWKATSLLRRQQLMFKFVALIREHWDRLAASITLEQGKTFEDAKGDVLRGLQVAETACGITTQLHGDVLDVAANMETRSYKEPLGVTAAICPFSQSNSIPYVVSLLIICPDFPAMIPLWCLPTAVITGNCIILKPSERDPGACMILAELAREAGFPPGVVNIVHGGAPTVDFILDEPAIKAISFVGSNKAGEYIYRRGSENGKRVQANLGAKNHAAVLPDANKNHAINAITGATFGAAGQRCMALSAIVTVGETKKWLPEIAEKARKLKVDAGFEEGTDVGPVISPQAKERIESLIASAEQEGATILVDGRGVKNEKYPNGNFVSSY